MGQKNPSPVIVVYHQSASLMMPIGDPMEDFFSIIPLPSLYEPQHEISNNVVFATNKASDQPAHMRSLIRAFASRTNILWMLSY